jgi:hypothetical protein
MRYGAVEQQLTEASVANTANLPNQTTITNSLQTSAIVYSFLLYNK